MNDCLMPDFSPEGDLRGFKIRPEIAKVIMWQGEGQDLSYIKKFIKTVNYINRLIFEPDDYQLGSRKRPGSLIKPIPTARDSDAAASPAEVGERVVYQEVFKKTKLSDEVKTLLWLLKNHHAAIFGRDDQGAVQAQEAATRDHGLDEMLTSQVPNIYATLTPEDR